jgi:hypothetical protein
MAKYLDTKLGSLEEAIRQVNEKSVSQAQQQAAGAALAAKRGEISPSELVGASKEMYDGMTEKELEDFAKTKHKDLPKKVEEDYYNVIYKDKRGKVEGERAFKDKNQAQRYADGGNKKDKVGGTYNVVKVKGRMEALDKVNPDAVKKKFDDRKDKDIDNDGDVDSTDKYLHKRRKAISKAAAKEEVVKEYNEIGTPEYTKHTLEVTPGQEDADWNKQVNVMHEKANTMREALAKVWGMKEGKNPFKKEEEEKPLKKTMTGEKPTKVEVEPKIKQ